MTVGASVDFYLVAPSLRSTFLNLHLSLSEGSLPYVCLLIARTHLGYGLRLSCICFTRHIMMGVPSRVRPVTKTFGDVLKSSKGVRM